MPVGLLGRTVRSYRAIVVLGDSVTTDGTPALADFVLAIVADSTDLAATFVEDIVLVGGPETAADGALRNHADHPQSSRVV